MLNLPSHFWSAHYKAARIPGSPNPLDLTLGANCQLFAFAVLHHFGVSTLPDFRSSDLWEDTHYTEHVEGNLRPLDLVLYHRKPEAWGAHVGVYLGDEQIVHLAKHLDTPVLWTHARFLKETRYAHYIGAKRVKKDSEDLSNL